MKTALTQLIEIVETAFELKNNPAWQQIFESHLEAEKEQIMEASVQANLRYDSGANEPVVLKYCNDAEQYYQQTFKTDE